MEAVLEKNEEKEEKAKVEIKNKEKKKFTILGYSVWRLLAYFIIYSVIGYIIETIYGMMTKGVWESRQSFLYGPFCGIYGLGAVVMIIFLQYFNKNHNTLFIGGFIVGSVVEYVVSLIGEVIFNVKWWDYSNMPLNINGRICVFFSLFWGFLAIYLMCYAHPKIDKFLNWIKSKSSIKVSKIIILLTTIFLLIDCIITGYALKMFFIRKAYENDLNVANREYIDSEYDKIYNKDKELSNFIYKFFGDEKMIKTFPNLKTQDVDGNIIYFDCFVGDIQTYYYKFNSSLRGDLVKILKHEN